MLNRNDLATAGQHGEAIAEHKAIRIWRFPLILRRLKALAQQAGHGFADGSALHLRNLARLKQYIGLEVKGGSHCGNIAS